MVSIVLRSSKCVVALCCVYAVFSVYTTRNMGRSQHPQVIREAASSMPLCRIDAEYGDGAWIKNEAITTYPYLSGDDYEWGPMCTELQKRYKDTGFIPDFLQYQWKPHSCEMLPFSKEHFCQRMDGQTIGLMGDSMMQQFAHAFMGRFLGQVDDAKYVEGEPDWFDLVPFYTKLRVPLCVDTPYNVTMLFHRWNKYQPTETDQKALRDLARSADYLILNWGVHYLPWLEMEESTIDFIQVLQEEWAVKKSERLFWRSTIVAHDNCGNATNPDSATDHFDINQNPAYNTNEILLQDEHIVTPRLMNSTLNVTFLRVEKSTMLRKDGHRVIGRKGSEDCLHYCEPGPVDSWVDLFYHLLVVLDIWDER